MVDGIDNRHQKVIIVELETSPEILAVLALVEVRGVGARALTVIVDLLLWSAGSVALLHSSNTRVRLVLAADVLICLDLLTKLEEARGAQVVHAVLFSHIDVEVPGWGVVLVGALEVEGVGLQFDWQHGFGIQVHDVETW